MPTQTIDLKDFQAHLDEMLALLREGTDVLIVDGGRPLARVTPVTVSDERVPDLFPGGWISDDFDAPLPEEFWLGE